MDWVLSTVKAKVVEAAQSAYDALSGPIPDDSYGYRLEQFADRMDFADQRSVYNWKSVRQLMKEDAELDPSSVRSTGSIDVEALLVVKFGEAGGRVYGRAIFVTESVFQTLFGSKTDVENRRLLKQCMQQLEERQKILEKLGSEIQIQIEALEKLDAQVQIQTVQSDDLASTMPVAAQRLAQLKDLVQSKGIPLEAHMQALMTQATAVLQDPEMQRRIQDLNALKGRAIVEMGKKDKIIAALQQINQLLAAENTAIDQIQTRIEQLQDRDEALVQQLAALKEKAKQLTTQVAHYVKPSTPVYIEV